MAGIDSLKEAMKENVVARWGVLLGVGYPNDASVTAFLARRLQQTDRRYSKWLNSGRVAEISHCGLATFLALSSSNR